MAKTLLGQKNLKNLKITELKIKGYPFIVDKAIIGVCDKCGAKHYSGVETKKWEELFEKQL